MGSEEELHPTLHTALHLDGSAESIKQFYSDWANRYEEDTMNWQYAAPSNTLYLLQTMPDSRDLSVDPRSPDLRILDAGCGTGLLARVLNDAGYTQLDGFDLSEDMVKIANELQIYRHLESEVDINAPVRTEWQKKYDCTVSIGVFTPGHVPPQALSQLVKMTRSGGIIIVSTRLAYYESENFQQTSDELESRGEIKLVHALRNASYTNDEKAHYWVYVVLTG